LPVAELDGKVAVVTGGSLGIGRATARRLAQEGAAVVLCGHDDPSVEEALAELRGAGLEVDGRRADVTSSAEMEGLVRLAAERYGGVDILVNSAGIQRYGTVVDSSEELWDEVLAVNLKGMFLAAKHCVPELRRRGGGAIVNVASVQAFAVQTAVAAYAASKGGVVGLTLSAARDLADKGIRVMTVAPGTFETPMLSGLPGDVKAVLEKQVPHPSRLGRPEEYANLVAHIVDNAMLNGEVIRLDGALRMPPR
jgi:NAD(P)-dependent dehydrogenase (short-subunit alcohol dehydrogenase family)